jgi:hypothetical protein
LLLVDYPEQDAGGPTYPQKVSSIRLLIRLSIRNSPVWWGTDFLHRIFITNCETRDIVATYIRITELLSRLVLFGNGE